MGCKELNQTNKQFTKFSLYSIACANGVYGQDCSMSCGNCVGGESCNPIDGMCPSGCEPGWEIGLCSQGKDYVVIILFLNYVHFYCSIKTETILSNTVYKVKKIIFQCTIPCLL